MLTVVQPVGPIGSVESKDSYNGRSDRAYYFRDPYSPNPKYKCCYCLAVLGYGYDRIAKSLRCNKVHVYRWLKINAPNLPKANLATWYRIRPKTSPKIKPLKPTSEEILQRKNDKKLKVYLRSQVWGFIKHGLYPNSAAQLVGCSRQALLAHLKGLFAYGMELSNYGKEWEIDHIAPCKLFNLRDPVERKKCFHFSNLRPLWPSINRRKAASVRIKRARSAPKLRASHAGCLITPLPCSL